MNDSGPWAGSGLTMGEIKRMTAWYPRDETPHVPVKRRKPLKRAIRAKVRRLPKR